MDDKSKAISVTIPGMHLPEGVKRPYAKLERILAGFVTENNTKYLRQIFFLFRSKILEVSSDIEFFSSRLENSVKTAFQDYC
jgi:hypothetical protein